MHTEKFTEMDREFLGRIIQKICKRINLDGYDLFEDAAREVASGFADKELADEILASFGLYP